MNTARIELFCCGLCDLTPTSLGRCKSTEDLPSGAYEIERYGGEVTRHCGIGLGIQDKSLFDGCDAAQVEKVGEVKPLVVEGSGMVY